MLLCYLFNNQWFLQTMKLTSGYCTPQLICEMNYYGEYNDNPKFVRRNLRDIHSIFALEIFYKHNILLFKLV